jgi:hypothetical protein
LRFSVSKDAALQRLRAADPSTGVVAVDWQIARPPNLCGIAEVA